MPTSNTAAARKDWPWVGSRVIIGSTLEAELSPSPREGLYENGPDATENEVRSEVAVAQ